jgi:hypothetical protein
LGLTCSWFTSGNHDDEFVTFDMGCDAGVDELVRRLRLVDGGATDRLYHGEGSPRSRASPSGRRCKHA